MPGRDFGKKRAYSKYSGILIDDKILMDVGEKSFLKTNPEIILFTHFHPDHAFFLRKKGKVDFIVLAFGPERLSINTNHNKNTSF